MATLLCCHLFILVLTIFHRQAEAVSSTSGDRDLNRALLAFNPAYDNCREISGASSDVSKSAADQACDQAFRALDDLKYNSCHGWRNAACRVVPGDKYQYYQCTCIISYCDDSAIRSGIVIPLRQCAPVLKDQEESAGKAPAPTENFQKVWSQYDDALLGVGFWRVFSQDDPFDELGSSSGLNTIGELGPSTSVYNPGYGYPSEEYFAPSYGYSGEEYYDPGYGVPSLENSSHTQRAPSGARIEAHGQGVSGTASISASASASVQPGTHVCDECGREHRSARALFDHKRCQHDLGDAHCYICNISYINRKSFLDHLRRRHHETFKEEVASRSRPDEAAAVMPHPCQFCPKRFGSKKTLAKHMKSHTSNETKCPACGKLLSSRASLKNHLQTYHPTTPMPARAPVIKEPKPDSFVCGYCGKSYTTQRIMRSHEKTHKTEETRCRLCNQILASKYVLKKHLEKMHPKEAPAELDALNEKWKAENPEVCEKCGKRYKNRRGLREHLESHDGKTKCDECGAVFSRTSYLNLHKRQEHKK